MTEQLYNLLRDSDALPPDQHIVQFMFTHLEYMPPFVIRDPRWITAKNQEIKARKNRKKIELKIIREQKP